MNLFHKDILLVLVLGLYLGLELRTRKENKAEHKTAVLEPLTAMSIKHRHKWLQHHLVAGVLANTTVFLLQWKANPIT